MPRGSKFDIVHYITLIAQFAHFWTEIVTACEKKKISVNFAAFVLTGTQKYS